MQQHKGEILVEALITSSFIAFCRHKVLIVEGNYLFLDEGVWKDVSSMFDEKWYGLTFSHVIVILNSGQKFDIC